VALEIEAPKPAAWPWSLTTTRAPPVPSFWRPGRGIELAGGAGSHCVQELETGCPGPLHLGIRETSNTLRVSPARILPHDSPDH
jgi:hypothetical protein